MKHDIFISYSRKNITRVTEIKRQIDNVTSTECWIDLKGIESGSEQFINDIIGGIDSCKVFLFMLSEESQQSEYALLELNYAKLNNKHVVLVNIDDCQMKGAFLFKYSLTDTIAWSNLHQRDKLLRDLSRWIGGKTISSQQPLSTVDPLRELEERLARLDKEVGELHPHSDKDGHFIGYSDKNGYIVIRGDWTRGYGFHEGLALIWDRNYKYGFIDKSGHFVIPSKWKSAWSFHNGIAFVKNDNNEWGIIDKCGRIVVRCQWKGVSDYSEGLAKVTDFNNKKGYIDERGRVVIPLKWSTVGNFKNGIATVGDASGKCYKIDKTGRIVG